MNSLPPFTELKYAETPKENKRRWRVGELCQETDTSNAHCFIRLWFDHPDRALWKRAKTIKLAVRLSLRAWNKAAILQWLQVLIHPSEVTKVEGQHIGESILLSVALNSRLHYQMDAEKSIKLFLNTAAGTWNRYTYEVIYDYNAASTRNGYTYSYFWIQCTCCTKQVYIYSYLQIRCSWYTKQVHACTYLQI